MRRSLLCFGLWEFSDFGMGFEFGQSDSVWRRRGGVCICSMYPNARALIWRFTVLPLHRPTFCTRFR